MPIPAPIAIDNGLSPLILNLLETNPLRAGSAIATLGHPWFPTILIFLSPRDFKKQVIGSSRTFLHLNASNIGYSLDDSQSTYTKFQTMKFVTTLVKKLVIGCQVYSLKIAMPQDCSEPTAATLSIISSPKPNLCLPLGIAIHCLRTGIAPLTALLLMIP